MAARFDSSLLHPELRTKFARSNNPPVVHRWQRALLRGGMRLMPGAKPARGVTVERVAIPGGQVANVFTPSGFGADAPGPALLWIHGGGLVIGSMAQDDARCLDVAAELGIVVVSVEYRLAPEHPYPAPLDDCDAAWAWLHSVAAARRIDSSRVAIGGQSAGGGLAAALVQRIHDRGGVQPVAQWLFCPMLDDRTAADRSLDAVGHFIWNNRSNRAGWGAYLGSAMGGADVPAEAAPARRTDLTGLPPAWIGAGDIELFFAEDRDYAERLAAAGVEVEWAVVPGAPHGFESMAGDTAVARTYVAGARRWLASQLGS
ncbi:alpha/beta hydrolase [Agromyces intestinalis]|uniref:Alpha/beta hydrolase n=1 Tax=Agromyces intestinalis TaxID=2592652 RepID=A0A5C1YGF6_9MICO|nr:alpha/beta hydrolase [Agromyces intestinalis]QEO13842.1 alpha/beta hydrolase [Agromyces intestinalis]